MKRNQIMNWVWDNPLTTTIFVSIPTFIVVVWIGLKKHIF